MSASHLVAAARAAGAALGLHGGGTVAHHAARLGCGPKRLGALLAVLAEHGGAAASDAPGAKLVVGAVVRDAPLGFYEVAGNPDAARLACHDGITRVPARLIERIAARVGDGVMLDLGCGDGAIASAVLAAAPACRVRLVDRDVRHVAALRGPRCDVEAGDAEAVAGLARVVVVSNVLHVLPPGRGERVVRHALARVEPGGVLIVREVAADGPFGAAFALSLLLFGEAELPATADLLGWLGGAGDVERVGEAIVVEASTSTISGH